MMTNLTKFVNDHKIAELTTSSLSNRENTSFSLTKSKIIEQKNRVCKKSSKMDQYREFLSRFHSFKSNAINIATGFGCLIDKTKA